MLHGRQSSGILAVVFPVIREVILEDSPRLGHSLDRDHIGWRIAQHPRSAGELRAKHHGQKGSFDEWCRNLVDWYGAKWTSSEDEKLGRERYKRGPGGGPGNESPFQGVRRIDVAGERYWLYEADTESERD